MVRTCVAFATPNAAAQSDPSGPCGRSCLYQVSVPPLPADLQACHMRRRRGHCLCRRLDCNACTQIVTPYEHPRAAEVAGETAPGGACSPVPAAATWPCPLRLPQPQRLLHSLRRLGQPHLLAAALCQPHPRQPGRRHASGVIARAIAQAGPALGASSGCARGVGGRAGVGVSGACGSRGQMQVEIWSELDGGNENKLRHPDSRHSPGQT